MKIVEASHTRAIDRLLTPAGGDDRAFERRVQRIVDQVRSGGDGALAGFARRFDKVSGPIEVTRKEMRDGAARVEPAVRLAIAQAAANIATVAFHQIPKHFDLQVARGVSVEQRVEPLDRVAATCRAAAFPSRLRC
jgi:histidinol dehydrogenase